jgi:hypothetical protein
MLPIGYAGSFNPTMCGKDILVAIGERGFLKNKLRIKVYYKVMSAWPFFIANKASPPQGKNIFEIIINVHLACSKQLLPVV